MTDAALINPVREKNEPVLPDGGVFYINPSDAHRITSLIKTRQSASHFLYNSRLLTVPGNNGDEYFVAGPSVGAPMAVMTLEKLIALGAKRIIMYGWCGTLSKKLEIGTLLLPSWGIPGEGTSGYYPGNEKPASSERLRNVLCNHLRKKRHAHATGPVWSTDAVYRETRKTLDHMAERSVIGVDMEFTALARVAEFRNIDFAAVLLVSDELWRESWVPGFKDPQFKIMNKQISTELLDVAETLRSIEL